MNVLLAQATAPADTELVKWVIVAIAVVIAIGLIGVSIGTQKSGKDVSGRRPTPPSKRARTTKRSKFRPEHRRQPPRRTARLTAPTRPGSLTPVPQLVDRLERLLLLYADVISIALKSDLMMVSRVMPSECRQFLQIPALEIGKPFKPGDVQSLFRFRFVGLMGTIKHVKRVFKNACETATDEFEMAAASLPDAKGM